MRLNAHAEKGEWFEIDKLARQKKLPVGMDVSFLKKEFQ
jgi:hypothetical protein